MNYKTNSIGIALILTLLLVKFCNKPQPLPHNVDYKEQLELAVKQHGHEASILMNELTEINKKLADANNKYNASNSYANKLAASNIELIKKLRQNAPKDCQPYIDSVDVYHIEIENAKDSVYADLLTAKILSDSASVTKDSVIIDLNLQVGGLKALHTMDKADLKQAQKEARKQKRGKVAAYVIGGALFVWWAFVGLK
jgi:hypothetical protein